MHNQTGGFICYELMTPDPTASKTFHDSVVGWNFDVDQVALGTRV